MDDDPLALLLKFGFLAVLYLFLILVARSAARDLSSRGEQAVAVEGPPRSRRERRRRAAEADERPAGRPRLEVVAALGLEPGTTFDIEDGLTMGRAETADVKIEDPYASSAHARIYPRGQTMYIEDMGSTNGTYLNETLLRRPERINPSDTVRIGETEYRFAE